VWSLWLSSLVVGYATIVWTSVRPGMDIARGAWRERAVTGELLRQERGATAAGASILIVGGLFLLAFFTIHFGGFHYVHSQFLTAFFPLDGTEAGRGGAAGASTYIDVARRYWQFLPAAFLAERAAFLRQPAFVRLDASEKAGGLFIAPYRNVLRMHLLIFFFAFAHFARLDYFLVYAVVYAAYFFPWRLLRDSSAESANGVADLRG
jgi:hypothetical protein